MAQNNDEKNTDPTSDAGHTDPAGEGATRGDSIDETRPMKKITGASQSGAGQTGKTPSASGAGDVPEPDTEPAAARVEDSAEADDSWDLQVTHEPGAEDGGEGDSVDEQEELDWGERWKITRQFMSMSRSSAVLVISFLLVLLLYMWVKEDPLVTLPANDPAESSETGDPSATTDPSGETSATGTSEADPSGTQESSAVPTGEESVAPTTDNQGSDNSQVPTQGNTDQGQPQTDGTSGTGGTGETGGQTDGQGTQGGADTSGQGTGQSGQGADAGTAQGTGDGQEDAVGGTGGTGAA